MKRIVDRVIGPCIRADVGPRCRRPDTWGALDHFGQLLEAASGGDASSRVEVSVHDMRLLGSALRRIAAGEDAQHVFDQGKVGHRPSERLRKQTIARIYYRVLAQRLNDGAREGDAKRAAIREALRLYPEKPVDATTVEKYARTHQSEILAYMDDLHRIGSGPSTDRLRAHLAKHGEHFKDDADTMPRRRR